MGKQLKFDCGNRNLDCDDKVACPCLLFINHQMESYGKVLQSNIFKEATKEEQNSVDRHIKEHSVDTGITFNNLINNK